MERWEDSEVASWGGWRAVTWQVGKDGEPSSEQVARWERRKAVR